MSITTRPLEPEDWPDVERIYAAGIATGHATFEAAPPSWEQFDAGKRTDLRLVAIDTGRVVGWAAASAVSTRRVYEGVVEHSVYVDPTVRGRGVGGLLLAALIDAAECAGCGRSNRASSPRTPRASACTNATGSDRSAPANASPS